MPLLAALGIFAIIKLIQFFEWLNTNVQPFTSYELQSMRREMSGKNEAQCRQVLNKYSNGKRRWQNWLN